MSDDIAPSPATAALLEKVDHLIYGAADLQTGMDEIERLLGVRPAVGGRHEEFGTHNALLSFGATSYLEIIAADPGLERPEAGRVFGLDGIREPRLTAWMLRAEAIAEVTRAATSAGLDLGPVRTGGRVKPDGSLVSWRVTDPYALRLGGAVPFLIAWGTAPHPAATAPRAGELVGLRIEHPEPTRVRDALSALGLDVRVDEAPAFRLVAAVRTDGGVVEIR